MLRSVLLKFLQIFLVFATIHFVHAQTSTAQYSVSFQGNWTTASVPSGVVSSAHFTTLAGGLHSSSVSFWEPGGTATSGLESLAELGATTGFLNEVRASSHTDTTISKSPSFSGTGVANFNITVKRTHPLITFATMIGPSPDWFVGLHGYSLMGAGNNWRESVTVDLFPYDAGTENGNGFSLSNPATVPQGVITSLKGVAPFSSVPMARITFTRTDSPPPAAPTITAIERVGSSEYSNANSLSWNVTFSETVQNVDSSDFTVSGTTASVTSATLASGSTRTYVVTASGGNLANLNGTVELGLATAQDITNSANVTLSSTLPSGRESYIMDNIAPTISSISPTSAVSSPFTVTITVSETLASTSFSSSNDVTSGEASLSSVSRVGSSYRVTVTVTDPSLSQTIGIDIQAGAAVDRAGNTSPAFTDNVIFTPPNDPPTISSIERPSSASARTNADSVTWLISFSEAVQNVSADDFTVANTTAQVISVSPVAGSTTQYSLTVSGGNLANLNSVISLRLASAQNIVDSNGASLVATLPSNAESYTIDNNAPTVTSVTPTSATSSPITVSITFSETLTTDSLTGSADITSAQASVSTPSKVGSLYQVVVRPSNPTMNQTISLTVVAGAAEDLAGNTSPAYNASIEFNPPFVPEPAIVNSVTAMSPNGVYTAGDELVIAVVFSKAVVVTGTPTLLLAFDEGTGAARYVRGTGSATLVFEYTLAEGQTTADLGYVSDESLRLSGGSIRDVDELAANLTLPTPGATGSLSRNSNISVSEPENQVPSFGDASIADIELLMNQSFDPVQLPAATGGDGSLTYSLTPALPAGLALDLTARTISGLPSGAFDSTIFSWQAMDQDGDSVSLNFNITVVAVMPLQFVDVVDIGDLVYIQGDPIKAISLPTARGGLGELSFGLSPELPPGLSLNTVTKEITGTPTSVQEETQYTWQVQDGNEETIALTFSITVLEDLKPTFGDVVIADRLFKTDEPILAIKLPAAMGGNGALTYTLMPELPEGLALDVDANNITGSPEEAQAETTYIWQVSDEDGDSASLEFSIHVIDYLPLSFSADLNPGDQTFTQDSAIGVITLPLAQGGYGDLMYVLSPELPAGLSLNMETREISGTPSEPMDATMYTWRVTDELDGSAELAFNVTVLEDLMPSFAVDAAIADQTYIQGDKISTIVLPTASGGNGELSYMLDGDLPSGLVLEGNQITGTPDKPTQAMKLTWSVNDTDGDQASLSFVLTVLEDLQPTFVSGALIPDQSFIQNSPISEISLPLATGGNGDLIHEITPDLPPRLSVNLITGVLSGTPANPLEAAVYTWQATDEDGDTVALQFTLIVVEDLQPVFNTTVESIEQTYIQDSEIEPLSLPVADGGNGELTYSLEPSLPEGLELDLHKAVVSGTPSEILARTKFTWSVTDVDGDAVSFSIFLTVLEDLQPSFGGIEVAEQMFIGGSEIISFELPKAESGNGDLSYVLEPSLPSGLVLDVATRTISGTPDKAHQRTEFSWTANDIDGDTATLSFFITILEDLQPSFAADVMIDDRSFVTDSEIESILLPEATGGNGELTYTLMPDLPAGLAMDSATRSISGTPSEPLARTEFTWTATDVDGDTASVSFNLNVELDTQPTFADEVQDQTYVAGIAIGILALPRAAGGNGELSYVLAPAPGNGLNFDAASAAISGTPTMEAGAVDFSWTVTDGDGDMASISFSITVNPAQPDVIGSIANVQLVAGGNSETVNARAAVSGRVDSWQVEVSDTNVVSATASATGMVSLTPRAEGQTSVSVRATNVTGSVEISFSATVSTDPIENTQVDVALSLQAESLLAGAINVFKKRSNPGHSEDLSIGLASAFYDANQINPASIHDARGTISQTGNDLYVDFSSSASVNPSTFAPLAGNVPLNLTHSSSRWSVWGALDRQGFSSSQDENEVDGSMVSLYLGADLAVSDHVFTGIAVARHTGTGNYEFASENASGDAELDTSLTAFYPYLQAGDGDRFSMFLVGGFGGGTSEISRTHSSASDPESDASLSLIAGGFDYVLFSGESLDFSLVGDAGTATLSTEADSGILADREASSSKVSVGGSFALNREVQGGTVVTSADLRFANGGGEEDSGSGFEVGANLNYVGERVDFMLDGRTQSRDADVEVQRSSISARIRFKAGDDDSGLTLSINPRWQSTGHTALSNPFDRSAAFEEFFVMPSAAGRALKGEIGYGFWTMGQTALLTPTLSWQVSGQNESRLQLGSQWLIKHIDRPDTIFSMNLMRQATHEQNHAYGLGLRFNLAL